MRKGKVGFWMRLAELIVRPTLGVMTARDWRGQENIPAAGPAILVANHISNADPLVLSHYVYDRPRALRFLAKESLFRAPVIGPVVRGTGQIPVHRSSTDAAKALESAVAAVNAGEAVIIYPEGTCTKEPDLWPMQGKTGAARLALLTGAPVIPIVQWGAHHFQHPVTKKIRMRPRTPIVISAGPPVDFGQLTGAPATPENVKRATELIMLRLRDDLAKLRGEPAPQGPLFVPPKSAKAPA